MKIFLRFIRPLLGKRLGVSNAAARSIGSKAEVIGSFVDTSLFNPEEANPEMFLEKNNIAAELIIFYPSRITSMKRQLDLVEVARKIREDRLDLDFKIVIIGPSNDDSYLEKIRDTIESYKLEDYVIILPPLQDEELRDAYASADIVVLPSYSEGLPLVILEALSMKKPVVANAVGGVPEVVVEELKSQTGFLVTPGDIEEMTERIIELLDNPAERRRIGENGRKFVMEHYSLDELVDRHLELYHSLVEEREPKKKIIRELVAKLSRHRKGWELLKHDFDFIVRQMTLSYERLKNIEHAVETVLKGLHHGGVPIDDRIHNREIRTYSTI